MPLSTIAQIVRDSLLLELSPTVVCVVLAGVAGSKIASELGNMRVSEQIDALEIMGINTKSYLILPKITGFHACNTLPHYTYLWHLVFGVAVWLGIIRGLISTDVYDSGLRRKFKYILYQFCSCTRHTHLHLLSVPFRRIMDTM